MHVQEPVDQRALQRRAGALVDREPRAGDLGAARRCRRCRAPSAISQCGRRRQSCHPRARRPRSRRRRLVHGQQLAPCPDGDVRVLATDRDVRIGRVRDPQQELLDLRLDRRELGVDRVDLPTGLDRSRLQRGDLLAIRLRRRCLIASPICLLAVLRSALRTPPSAEQLDGGARRARAPDQRSSGPRPCRRHPSGSCRRRRAAAAARRSSGQLRGAPAAVSSRSSTNAQVERREQPARARPVRSAQERGVDRGERPTVRDAGLRGRPEDHVLPRLARKRPRCRRSGAEARRDTSAGRRPTRPRRDRERPRGPRRSRAPARTTEATHGRRRGVRRRSAPRARSSGAPFSASTRARTSTFGICTRSARWRERRPECRRFAGHVRIGIEKRVAEDRVGAERAARRERRDPRSPPPAGRTRRTGAGSRPSPPGRTRSPGSAGAAGTGSGPARRARRRRLVGRGADALRRRHLPAADVQELVGHVERRLAFEDLAGDRVGSDRATRRPSRGPCRTARS